MLAWKITTVSNWYDNIVQQYADVNIRMHRKKRDSKRKNMNKTTILEKAIKTN